VLVKIVDDDLRIAVALQLDNDTCSRPIIADGADVAQYFVVYQFAMRSTKVARFTL
jgi:hypothetical protein